VRCFDGEQAVLGRDIERDADRKYTEDVNLGGNRVEQVRDAQGYRLPAVVRASTVEGNAAVRERPLVNDGTVLNVDSIMAAERIFVGLSLRG
jgi:hypothetical protein